MFGMVNPAAARVVSHLVESERVSFVNHKDQRVLLIDLSEANVTEISTVIEQSRLVIGQAQPQSLLTLTDVTNIVIRDVTTRQIVQFVIDNKPFVRAAAVVGVSGLARSILATTNLMTGRNIKPFDTREQALDWLVSSVQR